MISKAEGIVLNHFPFSNSSVIASIYTKEYGKRSYVVKGAKGRGKNRKANLLQPLTSVELTANHKEGKQLHTLSSINVKSPYLDIPTNIHKTGVAIFVSELVSNTVPEDEQNDDLFHFLELSSSLLDHCKSATNFPLLFMVKFTRFLGFFPHVTATHNPHFFDLRDGVFCAAEPAHEEFLEGDEKAALLTYLGTDFDRMEQVAISHSIRAQLIESMLSYYRLHTEGMKKVKSHKVLAEVFGS